MRTAAQPALRWLLIPPLALLLASCGGGGGDPTAREITEAELVAMLLPLEDFGSEYADFEFDEDESGFQTLDDEADDGFDEEQRREDLEQNGWVTGYDEDYTSTAALLHNEGVFGVASDVDVYEDADGASADLQANLEDTRSAIGESDEGLTLEAFEEFPVEDVGQEAVGFVATFSVGDGGSLYLTLVAARTRRLIGVAAVGSFSNEDRRDEVIALARKLDDRILAVLKGDIEPEEEPTRAPTEVPGPPSGAVAPSDVLDSFRFSSEITMEVGDSRVSLISGGEFQAPDRLHCVLSGALGAISYSEDLIVIGDQAWLDTGGGFESLPADDEDVLDDLEVCAGSEIFWADYDFGDLSDFAGQPETRNGVATRRLALGELIENAGTLGFLPPDLEGVVFDAFDIWIAEDGGWPVALAVDISADADALARSFGLPEDSAADQGRVAYRVDITDASDRSITVEPPE